MLLLKASFAFDVAKSSLRRLSDYPGPPLKPKLIVKGLNLLDACLDADGTIIPGKTTLIITSSSSNRLKLLLGIVNSRTAAFYLKQKYLASSYNEGTTFTKEMINSLPVPCLDKNEERTIVDLVDRILATKIKHAGADTVSLEEQIDELLYRHYRLTMSDVATIEANAAVSGKRQSSTQAKAVLAMGANRA